MKTNELNNFIWANRYEAYLDLRRKGLKKQAQNELMKFILDFNTQDKFVKRSFIDFIFRLSRDTSEYNLYMPFNLYNEVFKPEIDKWREEEPWNSIPLRWSSEFDLLRKSIDINPYDQLSLDLFFSRLKNKISLNQHETEFGFQYAGDPQEDYNLINEYEKYIDNVQDLSKREKLKHNFNELKEIALKNIKIRT